jgi:hypothetical protein
MQFKPIYCHKFRLHYFRTKASVLLYNASKAQNCQLLSINLESYLLLSIASSVEP